MFVYLTMLRLHWVTPITSGERWSCTIFLEEDSLLTNNDIKKSVKIFGNVKNFSYIYYVNN